MHHSGHLPLAFEGPPQDFGSKNCQNASQGKHCTYIAADTKVIILDDFCFVQTCLVGTR